MSDLLKIDEHWGVIEAALEARALHSARRVRLSGGQSICFYFYWERLA